MIRPLLDWKQLNSSIYQCFHGGFEGGGGAPIKHVGFNEGILLKLKGFEFPYLSK